MNTIKQITFAMITLLFLNSCDEVDELSEVDIDTNFDKEITFTTNQNGAFTETIIINLADYGDINDYLDKIEHVRINSANYKVTAFPGDLFVSGNVTVVSAGQSFGPFTHSDFKDDFNNQTLYPLTGADKLNAIASILKDTNQLQVTFTGTSQAESEYTMTLKITLDVTVTAQAL